MRVVIDIVSVDVYVVIDIVYDDIDIDTDNIYDNTHIGTRYVILAKHWILLPDDGSA